MKHLLLFENYVNEYFDFDKVFDIDEEVLTFVFTDLLEKYPHMSFKLEEVDNKNFKIELFDSESYEQPNNLDDEFNFLKRKEIYTQIESHFDVMNFKIKELEYNKSQNKIVMTIHQLLNESYNKPRKGMKSRWSMKYKRSIDCSHPKGFSQINYCKRKRRGGKYKS